MRRNENRTPVLALREKFEGVELPDGANAVTVDAACTDRTLNGLGAL